jgi:hypothetical protein
MLLRILVALTLAMTLCDAQVSNVERAFSCPCPEAKVGAKAYLQSRGFRVDDGGILGSVGTKLWMRSDAALIDADGKVLTTSRIRTEFASPKPPFFIWSTPLHASLEVSLKPEPSGCILGITVTFHSMHRMVVALVPVNETLTLGSNGKLDKQYADSIAALLKEKRGAGECCLAGYR